MSSFLRQHSLRVHFWYALGLALALRLVCLWFVWGPQGLDDFLDNLIPAWRFTVGQNPDLHEYRGPLYMWILAGWLKIGGWVGVVKAVSQIRWVYFFQALCSLLAMVGVERLVRRQEDQWAAKVSLYLVAAHAVMPFASTRSFMESFVIGFLTLGTAFLVEAEQTPANENQEWGWKVWAGWILIGFSTLVRFQVGVIYIGWGIYLLAKGRWKQVSVAFFLGLLMIVAEIYIDKGYGRYGFQTLHDYYVFNQDQSRSGVMPWYNTWLTWLGALLFPVSFVLGRKWLQAFYEQKGIFIIVMLYVVTHCLYPHKEERYLFPIVALSLIFLARAWSLSRGSFGVRWIFQPFFWGFNSLALVIFCCVNTQVGLVGPYGDNEMISDQVLYLDYDHLDPRDWMSTFFTRETSQTVHPDKAPNLDSIESQWQGKPQLDHLVVMGSGEELVGQIQNLREQMANHHQCGEIVFASSATDALLFKMNPKFNKRRQATVYFTCSR